MGISFTKPAASPPPQRAAAAVGNNKMARDVADRKKLSTSASATMGSVTLDIDMEPLLEGMDYSVEDKRLFDLYRDIYYYDPIGGSYVDMYSTLAYGDLSLGGGKDAFLEPYYEVMNKLKLVSKIPQIQTDRLVTGAHVSSMLYDRKKQKFFDLMSHRFDDIEVTPLPLANQDPILEWNVPDAVREAMRHSSPRIKQLKEFLGQELVNKMEGGNRVELEPLGTIWLPRCPFTTGEPISCYRRLLPIWLMEKNLYRGTLIESGKRQRPILHAQLGDGGEWEPSTEEMEALMDLVQSADADPLGAVIATRLGVQFNEIRSGGEFWKVTDIWDTTTQYKLRALGASEALLSGDATFSNGDTGLMAFMESLAAGRNELTRCLFYEKVFPLVAITHGLAITRSGNIVRKTGMMDGSMIDVMNRMNDGSRLFIPTVHWNKRLRPESDQGQMEALRTMSDLGVPIPMRAIAAAAGYNLDQLLGDQDENLAYQRKLMDYKRRVNELNKQMGLDDSAGGGGGGSFSSVLPEGKPLGWRNRDWSSVSDTYQTGTDGKRHIIANEARHNAKVNEKIYRTIQRINAEGHNPLRRSASVSRVAQPWEKGKAP